MSLREDINFCLWCDFIERDFLEKDFLALIDSKTIYGATSNPAIFESAISSSPAYKQQINILQENDKKKIYEELAFTDIKRAADILKPLYEKNSADGFISIELDPEICDDVKASITEGKRIHSGLGAQNVMIKVPATNAGYEVMKELSTSGISVNATLIFSPLQAKLCAQALNEGMHLSKNKDIQAVVSVFVSRFDGLCDNDFLAKNLPKSKLGIMNATKCYHEVNKEKNQNIRTLFASTGIKDMTLEKSYYIDKLIYPNSVNTAPLQAIKAWQDNGSKEGAKVPSENECDEFFGLMKKNDFDLEGIHRKLLDDGLNGFKTSFSKLLAKLNR